jgi:hypothetical protein
MQCGPLLGGQKCPELLIRWHPHGTFAPHNPWSTYPARPQRTTIIAVVPARATVYAPELRECAGSRLATTRASSYCLLRLGSTRLSDVKALFNEVRDTPRPPRTKADAPIAHLLRRTGARALPSGTPASTGSRGESVKRPGQKPYAAVVGKRRAASRTCGRRLKMPNQQRVTSEDFQARDLPGARSGSPRPATKIDIPRRTCWSGQAEEPKHGRASIEGEGWPTRHLDRCRLVRYYRALDRRPRHDSVWRRHPLCSKASRSTWRATGPAG